MRRSLTFFLAALLLVALAATALAETPAERDARMQWWREARFGMFIHWGLYAVPAGTWNGQQIGGIGEWIMNTARIPVKDYAAFAQQFNPVKYDADAWVALAKAAGMKYIIITSKHHDGFAMFHSKTSPYNIVDATPFKRDPLKELAEACRRQGIKLGFYYSQSQDWHHPGGGAYSGHWDPAQDGDYDEYLRTIAMPQVREILSNYGPLAVLWWDTPVDMTRERAAQFLPLLDLQPGIITNNRLGGGFEGDSETPEQFIPATGFPGRDWETCMTMNDTWGFKSYDNNWKSSADLIRNLADIASKGGNYLLNVGPTAEGEIPAPSVERLREVGRWMAVNGDSIYATSASPFKRLAWGRCTQKPGRLYLHVFDWPRDGRLTVPVAGGALGAYLMATPDTALRFSTTPAGVGLEVPAQAPDPVDSVIVFDYEGDLKVLDTSPAQAEDGTVFLPAADAQIIGETAKLEGGSEQNIGYWVDADDMVSWQPQINQPGTFEVEINLACQPESAGSVYAVAAGDQVVGGRVEATQGWQDFHVVKLGRVTLTAPGKTVVAVRAITKPAQAVMNLRSITLRPVTP